MTGNSATAARRPLPPTRDPARAGRRGLGLAPQPSPGAALSSRPLDVLVVDDERQIVDFLCVLLEEEGYRALRAYDGAQAWELVRSGELAPDLVITDVMMPRMTGVQLIRRLKDALNGACPPVIAMSAVTALADEPGVRFLLKPFDIDRMLDLVAELTDEGTVKGRS
jgi:DNA-binding response OmpR family regulator